MHQTRLLSKTAMVIFYFYFYKWKLSHEQANNKGFHKYTYPAEFVPVVLQVLCSWLSNSPNYEEITKWYLGWKSMFSDQVLAHPSIKDKFNEALDIMNRAVSSSVGRWLICGVFAFILCQQQCSILSCACWDSVWDLFDPVAVATVFWFI